MRFRKGMTLKEFRAAQAASKPSDYGFGPVIPAPRKRGAARQPGGNTARSRRAAKPPKPAETQPDSKMRTEWFVDADRNGKHLELAAPEGEQQAITMRDNLIRQGWEAHAKVKTTFKDDPRFHQLARERT